MNSLCELGRRFWMLIRRRQFDADLEEEVRLQLELRAQEQIRKGLSPKEARDAASRQFGNATLLTEKSHMEWGWEWLERFFQDNAYGTRPMLRSPALTIVALLSLALGIGANTSIFSLLDAVMLRSLPVKNPAQLVLLGNAGSFASPMTLPGPNSTHIRSIVECRLKIRSSPILPPSSA